MAWSIWRLLCIYICMYIYIGSVQRGASRARIPIANHATISIEAHLVLYLCLVPVDGSLTSWLPRYRMKNLLLLFRIVYANILWFGSCKCLGVFGIIPVLLYAMYIYVLRECLRSISFDTPFLVGQTQSYVLCFADFRFLCT